MGLSLLPFFKNLPGFSALFGRPSSDLVGYAEGALHQPFDLDTLRAKTRSQPPAAPEEEPQINAAFTCAAPPFEDPYQDVIDRCRPHPKDPTVLFTTSKDDMVAIRSPRISAVIWVREIDEDLKSEIAQLQANPEIHDIAYAYKWDEEPSPSISLIRDDMRMLAHLRAELAEEPLTKPILLARSKALVDLSEERFKSTFATDADFHSDRSDVSLRLHTTYSGDTIQGLSLAAIKRLTASSIDSAPLFKEGSAQIEQNITAEDIVDDVPLYAVVAFKGKGYKGPDLGKSAPEHIAWRHRGPDRDRTDGIAAIFGLNFDTLRRYDYKVDFPAARI